jgi:hypothetical protein
MAEPPEQVEVKRAERHPEQIPNKPSLAERLYAAIFPILGGLILDFADLATFGPVGIYTGMIVGCTIGWLISGIYDFSRNGRLIFALLAGIYCTIPGTFFLPLATVISAAARFREKSQSDGKDPQRTARQ